MAPNLIYHFGAVRVVYITSSSISRALGGSIGMLPNAFAIPHPYLSKRHRWLDHPIEEHSHEAFRSSESGDCYGVLPASCHSLLETQ
jgi:hypothetical protein